MVNLSDDSDYSSTGSEASKETATHKEVSIEYFMKRGTVQDINFGFKH